MHSGAQNGTLFKINRMQLALLLKVDYVGRQDTVRLLNYSLKKLSTQ